MIYLDMDGVICDWYMGALVLLQMPVVNPYSWHMNEQVGEDVSGRLLSLDWEALPIYEGAIEFYAGLQALGSVCVLSSLTEGDPKCLDGKIAWLQKHGFNCPRIFTGRKSWYKNRGDILIDDKDENIADWRVGGVLFPRLWNAAKYDGQYNEILTQVRRLNDESLNDR